jgi:protein involved in polysaccharide export with SLBB domain
MHKRFVCKLLIVAALMFLYVPAAHSQDLLKGKDLSTLRVDQLSDGDIAKLKSQMSDARMTIEQAEQVALAKGMPATEFAKLKQRLLAVTNNNSGVGKLGTGKEPPPQRENAEKDSLDVYNKADRTKPLINPLIFGSELYTGVAPSFEPNLNLATPVNYILGPGDDIQVSVYGVQQYEGDLSVSPEGNISIPSVGQIKVAGLSIEAATQKIRTAMGNSVYPYLRSGGSKLSVTLSKIRSIRVTVIGSNRPGNFTVSSLATVFNVLYAAGGPSAFGSFREIQLYRNNKLERKIDLYRLLLQGDQSDNIGLKDNDVIRIPAYKTRVEIQGQVKRPGIFEVLPNEVFSDIIGFASGFTDTAYSASVKVFQRSEKERKVFDLLATAFDTYRPQSGDVFVVPKILNRFQNRVRITGSVFRPDVYELTPNLKVADLIRRADGLKEDAFVGRGQVIRLQEDLTRSIFSFDIRKALAGDNENNFLLRREDEVYISSVQELKDSFKVAIQGEIRMPGQYEYVENLTLKDLILQAGGFTDAAYKNIEIARLIKRDSIASNDNRASTIINVSFDGDFASSAANLPLQAFDVITVRRKAGYAVPEIVTVTGQVQYPGPYALRSTNERVSEVLMRAGGYTPDAYPEGMFLKRYKTEEQKRELEETIKKLQRNAKDSTGIVIQDIEREYDQIPLDIVAIQNAPGSMQDLVLKARDELVIPRFDGQVKVSGSVLLATQVPYRKGNTLLSYISEAGGFGGDAWRKKAYVVYANGNAAVTRHFLFFRFYPEIRPGSHVVVPKKPEKKATNVGEIIGISSALASLAGVVIALLRL